MKLLGQSESKLASYCKYRLANGLTVIVAQRPHTQTFAMCLEVNAGMRDGSPHLAHLVEHLVVVRQFRANRILRRKTRLGRVSQDLCAGTLAKHVLRPLREPCNYFTN